MVNPAHPESRNQALTFCDGVVPQAARAAGHSERPRRSEQQRVIHFSGDLPPSRPYLLEAAQHTCDGAPAVVTRSFRKTYPN